MYVSSIRQYVLTGCILSLISYASPAFSQNTTQKNREPFVTFEVPNQWTTIPVAISNSMFVAGYYSGTEPYAFVRDPSGKVSGFVPEGCFRTYATGVNDRGTVIGYCQPKGGFMRDPQGVITWLNCPLGSISNTRGYGINPAGAIAGICGGHGFVRSPQGAYETFDPPGSTATYAFTINAAQTVAGIYYDANNVVHGFMRRSNGSVSLFELPGRSGPLIFGAVPFSMNASGEITGTWVDANDIGHGYFRASNGTLTSFDVPGSISTSAFDINAAGVIAGYYADKNSVFHGFIRDGRGSFTSFDPPGSTQTIVSAINDRGVVAGYYHSAALIATAGFLRGISSNEFQPGIYSITDRGGLYADGGFYAEGDPTVRLWVFVAGNPAQHWTFFQTSDGFAIFREGTFQSLEDAGGKLVQSTSGQWDT
jgi:hypothetical protein